MTGWRKRQVVEMAREAHGPLTGTWWDMDVASLERFAELVRADERNRTWTQEHWTEYERNIAATEREACARLCDRFANRMMSAEECADAIRARGQA